MLDSQEQPDFLKECMNRLEEQLSFYLKEMKNSSSPGTQILQKSIAYSLQHKGKRFRPMLAFLTAEALNTNPNAVLPFAASLEMIHTYSLMHDDLPALDNETYRRGMLSNHKVFGEEISILAGDALLTEAFYILTKAYKENPNIACFLIEELALSIGIRGMVGGQAIDSKANNEETNLENLEELHHRKTGDLIQSSIIGAAKISHASKEQTKDLSSYGKNLGLTFQIVDDILDYAPERPEERSFPTLLGKEKSKHYLKELTQRTTESLAHWGEKAQYLSAIAIKNQERVQTL